MHLPPLPVAAFLLTLATLAACSPSSAGPSADGGIPTATCASPGAPTPGPADTHCAAAGPDGGALVQTVTLACTPDAAPAGDDGGGASGCPYGPTNYGMEADDDDCKYHVKWTSSPICEAPGGTVFKVVATYKADGKPLTGAGTVFDVFTTSPADCGAGTPASCDECSTHPAPQVGAVTEAPPGTYTAPVVFDQKGQWTVRFHFFGDCVDAPDAPHGHVAFHIGVP
jgi:hypothetical protein